MSINLALYHVRVQTGTVQDILDRGYELQVERTVTSERGEYRTWEFRNANNEAIVVVESENFTGDLSQNTEVFYGKNARNENRIYAINSDSTNVKTRKVSF